MMHRSIVYGARHFDMLNRLVVDHVCDIA